MNYNNIISALREIARDQLRLKAVNRFKAQILDEDILIKMAEDSKANAKKAIDICKFLISKIDPKDPRKEDITKKEEENIKFHEEDIKSCDETISEHKKTTDEINGKIAKIESGETKISKEDLLETTESLISTVMNEKAKGLAA